MPPDNKRDVAAHAWPAMASTALRVAFGLIWVVDAALTWTPQFADHYLGYLHNAAQGQAAWSAWWFQMWIGVVTPHAGLFVWLTRAAETALAAALVLGFARRTVYVLGALFSLLIWSTAEGFGGPYAVGATNMGAAIAYVLIFVALIIINYRTGPSLYSLDYLIERRWPRWRGVSEWNTSRREPTSRRVSGRIQAAALAAIAVLVFFLVAGLESSLHVKPPSPHAAAAAVSPLSLASSKPLARARDARLPPLTPGPSVDVKLVVTDKSVAIASGVAYQAWTYNDVVPGPVIHVRQGQKVNVTLVNHGTMQHSIDFHAAQVAPSRDFVDIDPGKSLHFSFVADVPGAFVYHCETAPILLHMANGMYGALIVSPKEPLPPAAESYVLVQSEWYTRQASGNLMRGDYQKMLAKRPDEVVFNGVARQYVDHPLPVIAGKRVRIYLVDAGPSLWTSFHVIGAMFDKVYPGGDPAQTIDDVSAYSVGPGQGAIFDLVMSKPGQYPFVDHDFANLMRGAKGVFEVHVPGGSVPAASSSSAFGGSPASVASTGAPEDPQEVAMDAATTASAATHPSMSKKTAPAGSYRFDASHGASLYTAQCSACHQAGGTGVPGAFPPLKGNSAVLNPDPAKQIDVVLHGLQGERIDGTSYAGAMPPFGSVLSDADIADIINHERSSWGNDAKKVTADQVKAARQ